jgi:cell division protein FtsZ
LKEFDMPKPLPAADVTWQGRIDRRKFLQCTAGAVLLATWGFPLPSEASLLPVTGLARDNRFSFGAAPSITLLSVGTGAGAVLTLLRRDPIAGATLLAMDTDSCFLDSLPRGQRFPLHVSAPRSFCSLPAPVVAAATREHAVDIQRCLAGTDLAIIIATLGGGTGTGMAPVVAAICREMEICTMALAMTPFPFEGRRRHAQAQAGLTALAAQVDTIFHLPGRDLLASLSGKVLFRNAYTFADEALAQGARGLIVPLLQTGLVCMDFADLHTLFRQGGRGGVAFGVGTCAVQACRRLRESLGRRRVVTGDLPLWEARLVWLSIEGPPDLRLDDLQDGVYALYELIHPEALWVWGTTVHDGLKHAVRVTLCAAGFDHA